jgi:hypothetical protein
MIPRHLKITAGLLLLALLATGIYVRTLKHHAAQIAPAPAEIQRPVPPPVAGPTVHVTFFVPDDQQGVLRREDKALPLPTDPAPRARELLRALIARMDEKDSPHALPLGGDVNEVYVVNGNLAVVDMNTTLADGHRSGVLAEELTVLSLVQTLSANTPAITRVKILVNGKERETLAGHVGLADFFDVGAVARLADQMQPSK